MKPLLDGLFLALHAQEQAVFVGKAVRQAIRGAVRDNRTAVDHDHALAHGLHFGQDVGA